jgi:hypothetical protein
VDSAVAESQATTVSERTHLLVRAEPASMRQIQQADAEVEERPAVEEPPPMCPSPAVSARTTATVRA